MSAHFSPPTVEDVLSRAAEIGLPEVEGRKFFFYYESVDWHVGKCRMKVWKSALAGWALRFQERNNKQSSNGAMVVVRQRELERVEARMMVLRNNCEAHQTMDEYDRGELKRLKQRQEVLRSELGIKL